MYKRYAGCFSQGEWKPVYGEPGGLTQFERNSSQSRLANKRMASLWPRATGNENVQAEVGRTPRGSVARPPHTRCMPSTLSTPGLLFVREGIPADTSCDTHFMGRVDASLIFPKVSFKFSLGKHGGKSSPRSYFNKRHLPLFTFKSSAMGWVGTCVLFRSTRERLDRPHSCAMVTLGHAFSNPAAVPSHYCKSP